MKSSQSQKSSLINMAWNSIQNEQFVIRHTDHCPKIRMQPIQA